MLEKTNAAIRPASLTERTIATARAVLEGQRGGWRAYLAFAGPAVIVSIAYVDPGNSPPTSRPALNTAMGCSGWCCSRT
jgi:manganese transport protein